MTPVDGEDCDSSGTLCQTDDGGVCLCSGQNDPSWNCFGGEDTPGAGGAGTGFGGRQGVGGRNQGGRTGFGGRESFGQGELRPLGAASRNAGRQDFAADG